MIKSSFLSTIADVFGTLEALTKIINMYNDTRCPLDVVDTGVGPINEDDLEAAELFNGLYLQRENFIGFSKFLLFCQQPFMHSIPM